MTRLFMPPWLAEKKERWASTVRATRPRNMTESPSTLYTLNEEVERGNAMHNSNANILIAEALGPTLDAFHAIAEESLQSAWHCYAEGCLNSIILDFGGMALLLAADASDDTMNLSVVKCAESTKTGYTNVTKSTFWSNFVGKPFGWGWLTVNQQGYRDGALLSFGGIIPQVMLNVVASSIKTSTIQDPAPTGGASGTDRTRS